MAELIIHRSLGEVPPGFGPCALTIGNFDGVHWGHQAIFRRLVEVGERHAWTPSVMTFDPHPTRIVAPARAPRLLSTPWQRCRWIGEAGIRQVLVLPFSREVSQLEPEQFVGGILVEKLQARAILVGESFRFGRGGAGNAGMLVELGARYGFAIEIVPGVARRSRLISSSEIRRLVETGAVSMAARLLGRPYSLEGEVVAGEGVGRRLTVPTLNIATTAEVLPAVGVYVTRTQLGGDDRGRPSVTNVGYRPTFDGSLLTIESFIFDGFPGTRDRSIRVEFLHRLREERRFPDAASLKSQILRDTGRAQAYFRRRQRWARAAAANAVTPVISQGSHDTLEERP